MSTLIQSSPTAGKAIAQIDAAMTARRVFGDPIENHGITVLPVGRVIAGAGRGGGNGRSRGWGGGFGVISEPLGVFVIDGTGARWVPVAARNLLFSAIAQPIELLRKLLSKATGTPSQSATQDGNAGVTKARVRKKPVIHAAPPAGRRTRLARPRRRAVADRSSVRRQRCNRR
jgi:uncharacterized spore protein YtfJ